MCCCEYLGYINGKPKYKNHYLHRWIMDAKENEYVDHIEPKNTLDNRRLNLRVTTNSKNNQNRKGANSNSGTGHRNVNWGHDRKVYYVQFCKGGEHYKWVFPLNQFEEACEFADKKREELFGEFAGHS